MYNDFYEPTTNMILGGVFAGMMVVFFVFFIVALILIIIDIVGLWRIFKKAGQPEWGALIPIYNEYLLCKIAGVNPWWILITLFSFLLNVIPIIGGIASAAVGIYFGILLNVSIARSFGKDDGFAVGLFLLRPIFHLILGSNGDQYIGPRPMNDMVFGAYETSHTETATEKETKKETGTNQRVKYCSNCGTKLSTTAKYCSNCGKEVK